MKPSDQPNLQKDLLGLLEEEGPIPTQTEIARKLGISQSSVSRHIRNLIDKGRVEKDDKGYDLVERNPEGNVNIVESLGKLYESPPLEKIGSNILNKKKKHPKFGFFGTDIKTKPATFWTNNSKARALYSSVGG